MIVAVIDSKKGEMVITFSTDTESDVDGKFTHAQGLTDIHGVAVIRDQLVLTLLAAVELRNFLNDKLSAAVRMNRIQRMGLLGSELKRLQEEERRAEEDQLPLAENAPDDSEGGTPD